jgi:arginine/ornithine N-succinyltransferase beta subunit
MVFVSRNSQGAINGLSASQQGGLTEMPDDDAEVLDYLQRASEPFKTVQTITPRQARLALLQAGLLPSVESAVQAAGGATKITWEFATVIERNSPLIETLGGSLGLTREQIDTLFKYAATQ